MSLLKQFASDNYIPVNRTFIKLFGLDEAVILGELCNEYDHWSTEDKLIDGMFYCSITKLEEKTGLTEYKQRQAIKNLENAGVLKTKLKGIPATRYFEIVEVKLLNYLTSSSEKIKELVPKKLSSSYTINTKQEKLINTISKDIVENPKPKKLNLYQKCVNIINEFTDDEILRGYLTEFLKILLENSKEENGTPLYPNTFKGKLNSLKKLSTDNYEQRKIVLQTLDNGWCGFYELKENKKGKSVHDRLNESGATNVPKIKKEFMEEVNNGNAEKF